MRHIEPFFSLCLAAFLEFDPRVISGNVFVIRNGPPWRDAPRDYGPRETVYNRLLRWSRPGVFHKILAELARKAAKPRRLVIMGQKNVYLELLKAIGIFSLRAPECVYSPLTQARVSIDVVCIV